MNGERRRVLIVVIVAVAIVALIVILPPLIGSVVEPPGGENVIVILKTVGPHMEFWQIVRAGIQEAASQSNIDPAIVGPRWERDIDRQIEIFENVINQSPDAILLAASDYNRLVPLAEQAAARGITIVTLDSALNSDVPVSFVATDNVEAGKKAGNEIDSLVGPDQKIAIINHIPEVATAIERENGVRQALSQRDPAQLLGTFYSENETERAYTITQELIANHPDLGGIVALNESSTVGVARALSDLDAYEKIKLVGFDNSKEEIRFLESGVIRALVVQRPFNMGYLGIRTVVAALRGANVDPIIHTDSVLVRQDEIFTEENQKLLFPIIDTP